MTSLDQSRENNVAAVYHRRQPRSGKSEHGNYSGFFAEKRKHLRNCCGVPRAALPTAGRFHRVLRAHLACKAQEASGRGLGCGEKLTVTVHTCTHVCVSPPSCATCSCASLSNAYAVDVPSSVHFYTRNSDYSYVLLLGVSLSGLVRFFFVTFSFFFAVGRVGGRSRGRAGRRRQRPHRRAAGAAAGYLAAVHDLRLRALVSRRNGRPQGHRVGYAPL